MIRMTTLAFVLVAAVAAAGDRVDRKDLLARVATLKQSLAKSAYETDDGWITAMKNASEAKFVLHKMLTHDPSAWSEVRAPLQQLPEGAEAARTRGLLVELLMDDDHESSRRIVNRALRDEPALFTDRMLIRLDCAGNTHARKALAAKLDGEPDFSMLQAATHLGLQGHAPAKKVLEWGVANTMRGGKLSDGTIMMAVALNRMGAQETWSDVSVKLVMTADAALKKHEVPTARWMVIQLEFYSKIANGKEKVDMGKLGKELHAHYKARSEALDSPVDVRKAIDTLKG